MQLRRCLHAHQIHDDRAPVAALRDKARVAQALHQLNRGTGDMLGTPAAPRRLAGEPVARDRRDHHIERVLGAAAVCRRVGERADDAQHLHDRARPAVDEDHRQRVLMTRLDVDEVNIEIVDLSQELRQGVQPRLDPPKVVLGAPVAHECFHRRQFDALRRDGVSQRMHDAIFDRLALRETGCGDARTQVLNFRLGKLDRERPDRGRIR